MTKYDKLDELRTECLNCRKCAIGGQAVDGKYLSNVFSNMNADAQYMVVGQNPGLDEAMLKEPFVGISGQMFNQLVDEVMAMKRSDFYISNTCHCCIPGNRRPSVAELDHCQTFLDREVKIMRPKLIIALGGPAFEQLTGMHGIMKHHGHPVFSPRYCVPVFPLLHPSPSNLNDQIKLELFLSDLMRLREYMSTLNETKYV